MTFDSFQKAFGAKLEKLLATPEVTVALMMLRAKRREWLLGLSSDDIQNRSREILGHLIGQLTTENDLMTLHAKREFKLPEEGQMEYVSPEEEAQAWEAIQKFREKRDKNKPKRG